MLVSIRHYEFDISEPWQAAAPLTEEGALILNRLRLLQIRENWTKRLPKSPLLSPNELAKARAEFTAYDSTYSYSPPPLPKMAWTLEAETRLLLSEGCNLADADSLARKRFTARMTGIITPQDFI